jgi:hypothetical protein
VDIYSPKEFLSEELAWLLPDPAKRQKVYDMLWQHDTVIVRLGHGQTAEEYAISMDERGRGITLVPWYAPGSDPDRPLPAKRFSMNPHPITVEMANRILAEHARVDPHGGKLEALIQGFMREAGVDREKAEQIARRYLDVRPYR